MARIRTYVVIAVIAVALISVVWLSAVGVSKSVPDLNPKVAGPSYPLGGGGGGGGSEIPVATTPPQNYILFNITTTLMVNPISWDQPLTSHLNGAITKFDVEIHLFAKDTAVETVQKIHLLPAWFTPPSQNMRTQSMINLTVTGPNGFYVAWNSAYQYDYFMLALVEVHSHDWTTGRLFIFESGTYIAQLTFLGTPMPLSGEPPPTYILAYKEAPFTAGG